MDLPGVPGREGINTGRRVAHFPCYEDRVLIIRRIHVVLRLKAAPEQRETARRVHRVFAGRCPVYRALKPAIQIATELAFDAAKEKASRPLDTIRVRVEALCSPRISGEPGRPPHRVQDRLRSRMPSRDGSADKGMSGATRSRVFVLFLTALAPISYLRQPSGPRTTGIARDHAVSPR